MERNQVMTVEVQPIRKTQTKGSVMTKHFRKLIGKPHASEGSISSTEDTVIEMDPSVK